MPNDLINHRLKTPTHLLLQYFIALPLRIQQHITHVNPILAKQIDSFNFSSHRPGLRTSMLMENNRVLL